jgi:hypothetical protein
MPITNYSNPSSMMSQVDWKPQGFLAGDIYADNQKDYAQQSMLSNIAQALNIMQTQAEHKNYLADDSVRASKRPADIATNQQTALSAPILGERVREQAASDIQMIPHKNNAEIFKNSQEREKAASSFLSNSLSALLDSKLPPGEMLQYWNQQIVADFERQFGKMPDGMKQANLQQLQMLRDRAADQIRHKQDMEKSAAEIAGREKVAGMNNDTRVEVQGLRNQLQTERDAGRLTGAQGKEEAFQRLRNALIQDAINQRGGGKAGELSGVEGARVEAEATLIASDMIYGGNTLGRQRVNVGTKAAEISNKATQREMRQAEVLPDNPKASDLTAGTLYKNKKGQFARWDGQNMVPVTLDEGNEVGRIPTNKITRPR